jgi:hypothetical protein
MHPNGFLGVGGSMARKTFERLTEGTLGRTIRQLLSREAEEGQVPLGGARVKRYEGQTWVAKGGNFYVVTVQKRERGIPPGLRD